MKQPILKSDSYKSSYIFRNLFKSKEHINVALLDMEENFIDFRQSLCQTQNMLQNSKKNSL